MRVLWTHNFDPSITNSGCFMYTAANGLRELGVDIHLEYLGNLRSPIRIAAKRKYIRSIAEKFDIVHAQYGSACALVTTAIKNRPIVLTIRGSDWKTYSSPMRYSFYHSHIAHWMTRVSLSHYNAIISVSERLQNSLLPFAAHALFLVLPSPIDLDKWPIYQSKKNNKDVKRVLFTSLSLLNDVKRYNLCKEVIKLANNCMSGVVLVTANNISYDKMPAFISSCDLIICTSESEGWPNSIKEALACNIPFVSTDVSDLAKIAALEPSCRVCKPDARVLAKNLCEVLQMQFYRNLRQYVEPMDIKNSSKKLLSFYKTILNS